MEYKVAQLVTRHVSSQKAFEASSAALVAQLEERVQEVADLHLVESRLVTDMALLTQKNTALVADVREMEAALMKGTTMAEEKLAAVLAAKQVMEERLAAAVDAQNLAVAEQREQREQDEALRVQVSGEAGQLTELAEALRAKEEEVQATATELAAVRVDLAAVRVEESSKGKEAPVPIKPARSEVGRTADKWWASRLVSRLTGLFFTAVPYSFSNVYKWHQKK
jgi:hypothetical protein